MASYLTDRQVTKDTKKRERALLKKTKKTAAREMRHRRLSH